jgi:hypothetical protein
VRILDSNSVLEADLRLERLLADGAKSFQDLVIAAKGRFPTEVLQFLETCRTGSGINACTVEAMIAEARTTALGDGLPQGGGLALPHPIDAEWRFTDETAEKLLRAAVTTTQPGDSILLMGVPSVVLAAVRSRDDRKYFVCGEQNIIADGLSRITSADPRFFHFITHGLDAAAAAILDPPWYVDQFLAMLSQASGRCRAGARIFASAPAENVRPGIIDDLIQIAEVASKSGLDLESVNTAALTYRTPFFEINALRAAGLGAWLPDWRRSNLTTYRKRTAGRRWEAAVKPPAFELTLSGVRLRLLGWDDDLRVEFSPLYEGEIFPSVSARAPRREEAALWTSGNRAFSAPKGLTLAAMLEIASERQLLPKGLEPELFRCRNRYPIDAVTPLIQKLTALADREVAEAVSLLGSAAWERSANDARFLNVS